MSCLLDSLLRGPTDNVDRLVHLLDGGEAFPYPEGPGGSSPAHFMAASGHARMTAELLRRRLIEPDPLDRGGFTPFLRAVQGSHVALAAAFLDAGAYLNAVVQWNDEASALHLAVGAGENREELVGFLVGRAINIRLRDRAGQTAVDRALAAGDDALATEIGRGAREAGPRWHREAIVRGIAEVITISEGRGEGLFFDPCDVQLPFFAGGSHEGPGRVNPAAALEYARRHAGVAPGYRRAIALIERLLAGEDLPLNPFLALGPLRPVPR